MTPTECVHLCKFVAARCPAMKVQDETPEAWYVDIVEFDLADALEAVRRATLRKAFIGIGDIVEEARAIVRKRDGERRVAELDAQVAAENGGEITERERPLLALMAGSTLKPVPRPDWQVRHGKPPVKDRPPFTPEELKAAAKLLEQSKPGDGAA